MNVTRQTKYSKALSLAINTLGHATNAELLSLLQADFPEVSATTIHRCTSRMLEQGKLSEAPASGQGAMRYDANTSPHDHFVCSICNRVRDIDIASDLLPHISEALGNCKVTGRLIIYGSCASCITG